MSTPKARPSFDDLLKAKAPVTVTDLFGVPPKLNQALVEARELVSRLQLRDLSDPSNSEQLSQAGKELDEARAEVREAGVEVVMRSIGRDAWEKLKRAHPPTDAQREEYTARGGRGKLDYNWDTFPPVAIAAAAAQPEMTVEQAQQLWDSPDWNEAECARLFEMAMEANETRQVGNLAF